MTFAGLLCAAVAFTKAEKISGGVAPSRRYKQNTESALSGSLPFSRSMAVAVLRTFRSAFDLVMVTPLPHAIWSLPLAIAHSRSNSQLPTTPLRVRNQPVKRLVHTQCTEISAFGLWPPLDRLDVLAQSPIDTAPATPTSSSAAHPLVPKGRRFTL